MTDECQGCVVAARRMLVEGIDATCDVCGAAFAVDADVLDVHPRADGARPDEASSAAPRPPIIFKRESLASMMQPKRKAPARRGEDLRSLLSLSGADREKVQQTIDANAQWGRIRLVVEELLRWERTEELNEKSASSCTNGSNWLRGVVGLVGADTLKARPDLRAHAKAPLWVGPGHDGSVGDMSNAMPEFRAIPVRAETIVRFDALSESAKRTARAIKNDGQGDQLVPRVLRDGQLPVALGLEQRIGMEVAPAEVLANWWRLLGSGDRAPLLAGSKQYGWEALCALEAEWNRVDISRAV